MFLKLILDKNLMATMRKDFSIACLVVLTLMQLKDMNIKVVGINYKDNPKNAKNFLNLLGNPYSEIITDKDGTKSKEFGAIGVPETIVINGKTKNIIKKFIGPLSNENIIEIKSLINEKT